jgi:hypothetical protein
MGSVTKWQAVEAVRGWWIDKYKAKNLGNDGQITDYCLKHVPFWKLRAKVTGFVYGYEYDSYESTTTTDKNYTVDFNYVWTGAACDVKDIGVKFLRSPWAETMPYGVRPGQLLEATVSENKAIASASKAMEDAAIRAAKMDGVRSNTIDVRPTRLSLIFYPLWIVKYSYLGRAYSATVDGVTGNVISGRAPGDMLRRCFYAISLASIFLITLGILIEANWCIGYVLILFLLGVCHFLMVNTLAFIRYGSVISCGEVKGGYKDIHVRNSQHNEIAVNGIYASYFTAAFSIFFIEWSKAFATFLAICGLFANILFSLLVCDSSYVMDEAVREDK